MLNWLIAADVLGLVLASETFGLKNFCFGCRRRNPSRYGRIHVQPLHLGSPVQSDAVMSPQASRPFNLLEDNNVAYNLHFILALYCTQSLKVSNLDCANFDLLVD